jgi:hypothetical protein
MVPSLTTSILLLQKGGNFVAGYFELFIPGEKSLSALLKSLILPTIEYCCQLWSSNEQHLINDLEKIQRSFTKKGLLDLSYKDRLHDLNVYSLERRREKYTILYIWKVLHGYYPNPGFECGPIDRHNGISGERHN